MNISYGRITAEIKLLEQSKGINEQSESSGVSPLSHNISR